MKNKFWTIFNNVSFIIFSLVLIAVTGKLIFTDIQLTTNELYISMIALYFVSKEKFFKNN